MGARGLVHEESLQDALEFFDIPREQRSQIVRDTVRASVEALAFMYGLRFSPSPQNRTFDTDDPQSNQVTNAADQNLSRKRKNAVSKESLASTLLRWSKILPLKRKWLGEGYSELEWRRLQLLAEYSTSDNPLSVFVCVLPTVYMSMCVYDCMLKRDKQNLSPKQNTCLSWNQ